MVRLHEVSRMIHAVVCGELLGHSWFLLLLCLLYRIRRHQIILLVAIALLKNILLFVRNVTVLLR